MGDGGGDLVRRPIGIATLQPLGGEAAQCLGRGFIVADNLAGILIDQFLKAEIDALRQSDRVGDGALIATKQTRHFGWRFEMAFGIRGEEKTGGLDRHMLADTGDHIGQRLAFGDMIERVIGGDAVEAECGGALIERVQTLAIATVETAGQGEDVTGP